MTINPKSIVFNCDSYKVSMWKQYPPGTEYVYSYVEARKGGRVLNFGLQKTIIDLIDQKVTTEDVLAAEKFWTAHGEPFNTDGWLYIANELGGVLPLEIRGIDEGIVLPSGTPVVTIVNTDPKCFWLTTWVETAILRDVWYASSVATTSYNIRQLIMQYLERSGDPSGIDFKLHDFGFRGSNSYESSEIGGAAHLISFMGTDTVSGIFGAAKYYGADIYATAYSVPAAEHSTITSWGRDKECLAYENMIKQFSKPGAIYAVVSDSYDIYNAVDTLWGKELRDKIISTGGTLVIRPDSADPVVVLPKLITSLEKSFGATVNDKGYKVLNNVRLLWGDGINFMSISSILRMIVDVLGYSADNIAFGMGGALHMGVNRDTYGFAMKASAAYVNGEWVDVFKDPITDPGKKSKRGRFDDPRLKLRYRDGTLDNVQKFDEIRANAK